MYVAPSHLSSSAPGPTVRCSRLPLLLPALALVAACSDYKLNPGGDGNTGATTDDTGTGGGTPAECSPDIFPAQEVGLDDTCPREPEGGFTPIIEWGHGTGSCLSQPIVADLDADGMPEILYNQTSFVGTKGDLIVLRGDGGGVVWQDTEADLGYGSPVAVADLDDDGLGEIVAVREYANSLYGAGDYTVLLFEHDGSRTWESEHFTGDDFDYASAPVISDMDHDGSPEIVVGRVILNADGTTRGVGLHGRGSYGITFGISESSVPSVADLDLDGQEEVIVGNARYDANGTAIWYDPSQADAMTGIANLDDDPEGEVIATSWNTIRAVDTDGSVMWGPITMPTANILSPPAIADVDDDGYPEIVTAGGNELTVFNHDGTVLWSAAATDMSGATGASFFDFEGDGILEVVYIDEVEMAAYEGPTGRIKFYSREHSSATMFDYPTVADVDADGHAEIVVCHDFYSEALSVYGELTDTWADARNVWNQHAYSINNINDDLSVPVTAVPAFTTHNTWHSGIATGVEITGADLQSEILEVCLDDCDEGMVYVTVRAMNRAEVEIEAGNALSLYAVVGGERVLLDTKTVADVILPGFGSPGIVFHVEASHLAGAEAVYVVADDDGTGLGVIDECSEDNNGFWWSGPFCG